MRQPRIRIHELNREKQRRVTPLMKSTQFIKQLGQAEYNLRTWSSTFDIKTWSNSPYTNKTKEKLNLGAEVFALVFDLLSMYIRFRFPVNSL